MPPGAPSPVPTGYSVVHAIQSPDSLAPCTELYGSTEKQLAQTARRGYRETALGTPQGGFPHRERRSDRIAKVDVEGSSPFTRSQACNRGQRPRLLRF